MLLRQGGLDIFYIDESHDRNHYVVTAVQIPFLRNMDGVWHIVWPDHLDAAKHWRRLIAENLHIPRSKELHGVKLASSRGNFLHGKHNLKPKQAADAYRSVLRNLFLPERSVMSVAASRGRFLYGHDRLEAALYALFQRMGRKCSADNVNAITFFDQGHPEYRSLYRMAQVYLPTGSALGGWPSGRSRNMPLDMFTKDGNEKNSKHCYFTQTADLVAYAAFLKIKAENDDLTSWQDQYFRGLYDTIPAEVINPRVSRTGPQDGIVRLT